jgi:chitosanase
MVMYLRGPYYRQKRHFPLLPKEVVAVGAVVVVGIGGFIGFTNSNLSSPAELAGRISKSRQASRDKANKAAVPIPAAPQTTISKAGNTAADAAKAVGGVAAPNGAGAILKIADLSDPDKKEIAMRLVSSAENSSLDWKAQFAYIEDIGDGRGYTAGIIGFCSGTGDMLQLVERYTKTKPGNPLVGFLPALRAVNGTSSHAGLDIQFVQAWKSAAADPVFKQAQEQERDRVYFDPAVAMAKADGLGTLGQFAYYDAAVMHGPDAWGGGLPDLRARALQNAKTPAQGGNENTYLTAFLNVRKAEMSKESAHRNVSRIDDAQLAFLQSGNTGLNLPLNWKMYGDPFSITSL